MEMSVSSVNPFAWANKSHTMIETEKKRERKSEREKQGERERESERERVIVEKARTEHGASQKHLAFEGGLCVCVMCMHARSDREKVRFDKHKMSWVISGHF